MSAGMWKLQADRQTQTDTHACRQPDRQTGNHVIRMAGRQASRQTTRQSCKQIGRQAGGQTDR